MIKFGPEWIRTLSNDGSTSGNSASSQPTINQNNASQTFNSHSSIAAAPRFAEHRYGREEMLSLYEREINAPQELQDFGNIFVRRKQPPLALTDNSEEDNNLRHWQRQNSNPGVLAPAAVGLTGLRAGENITHAPRGRGRQRQFHTPGQNTITYHNSRFSGRGEDPQASLYSDSGRSFYSSWNERGNATFEATGGEWTNQRRDFTTQPTHTNRWSDWRRPGAVRNTIHPEDGEDTRRATATTEVCSAPSFRHRSQGIGSGTSHQNRYSWRGKEEHEKGRYDRERELPLQTERDWGDRAVRERGGPRSLRRGWSGDGNDENSLPEWAIDTTNSPSSGSFDSSGAFHGPTKSGSGDDLSPGPHLLTHSHSHSSFMNIKNIPAEQQPIPGHNNAGLSRSLTQGSFNISKNSSKKHVSFAKEEEKKGDERKSESPIPSVSTKPTAMKSKQFDVTKINFRKVTPPEHDTTVTNSANLDWWSPGAMFVNENTAESKTPEICQEIQPSKQDFLIEKPFSELSIKDVKFDDSEMSSQSDTFKKESRERKTVNTNNFTNDTRLSVTGHLPLSPHTNNKKDKRDLKTAEGARKFEPYENKCNDRVENRSHSEPTKSYECPPHVSRHYNFNDESNIKSVLLTSTDKSLREQHQNFIQPIKEPVALPDLTRPPPQSKIIKQQPNLGSHEIPCTTPENFIRPFPGLDSRTYDSIRPSHDPQNEPAGKDNDYLLHSVRELFERKALMTSMDETYGFVDENLVTSKPQVRTMSQVPQPGSMYQPQQVAHSPVTTMASSNLWYYQDPQGEMQGPFDANNMALWYNSGFFKEDLLVRRDCDLHLYPLGSLGPTPPFLQTEQSPPPLTANANVLNFNQFPGVPKIISKEDFFMTQQHRKSGAINVDAIPSPMPGQSPLIYYPTPSPQVLPPMVQPALDSLTNSISSPVEQTTHNVTSTQPPMDESISAFLRQLNVSEQIQAPTSWNKPQNDMTWASNLFQQQRPATLWDSKLFKEPNAQPTQLDLDLEVVPNICTPLTLSLVSPKNNHPMEVKQQQPGLFDERTGTTSTEQAYNIWKNYELASVFNKPDSPPKSPTVEVVPQNIGMPNFQHFEIPQSSLPPNEVNVKKEQEKFYDIFSLCQPPVQDSKADSSNVAPLRENITMKEQSEDFSNMGFQKVPSKKEEKQMKLQKLKEAKKKADELRKVEEEQLSFMSFSLKESEENLRQQQFDAQKIQVQKQRTINAKIAPWSVTEMDHNGSKLSLSEIQKLEREKKLEQVREQETAMQQIFAQQQLQNQLREQESSQGWSKVAMTVLSAPQKSLTEIQMEELHQSLKTNHQVVSAKEMQNTQKQTPSRAVTPQNQNPWSSSPGFWESLSPTMLPISQKQVSSESKQASTIPAPTKKPEKIVSINNNPSTANKNAKSRTTIKKSKSSAATVPQSSASSVRDCIRSVNPLEQSNFDEWCAEGLKPWKDSVDIPTFVNFLKDVQSSYDVKDYIRAVIGETPEASLFVQQYLTRRSRLLWQSNDYGDEITMAPNSKLNSNEFQEVKGKNKKVKKNKMLKVDARILGFSTTASEDRINVHK